ncbi:Kv channel-interacting protein 4-like [Pollicipes pollicipes]|uniref:Kv channel-interacting protein 4-like n=1 Tax=Pollicipes pollicipes TaxID=41117 RepID=UPI001884FF94|nr:Kv channel-interacting protein 4-like [Pollicipes pollicipes]
MLASVNINLGRKLVRNWKDKGKSGAATDPEDTSSRYRPGDLQALALSTKFTRREIQFFYRGFKQECPSGNIDEDGFREIYAKFFPFGDSNQYAHLLFNVLDKNQSGSISFDDFIYGLSTLIKGSTEDRLAWTFSLYDVNNDGFITEDEMLQVVGAIYRLIDTTQSDHVSPEERGQDLFTKIDANHDGIITLEEFMTYCSKDATIMSGLDMYNLMWET